MRTTRRSSVALACASSVVVAACVLLSGAAPFVGRDSPADRIGVRAPALGVSEWIASPALGPEDLRGHVVLLRWWTDSCPFCASSAPALRELHATYAERGLRVIGVFHPKPPTGLDEARRRAIAAARRFGFDFPVAVDHDWAALGRWWLDHHPRGWTSVSFLLDREGTIRYVHPGGEYHRGEGGTHWRDHATCRRELAELEREIVALLGP